MRLSITFPIADSRRFLKPDKTGILKEPPWLLGLNPNEGDFVHFFGEIKQRKYKVKNKALNEAFKNPDCVANRAIRFCGSHNSDSPIFISGDLKFDLMTQRHFSFDSNLVGQFDISITNVIPKDKDQLSLTREQLEELVEHFLNLKVKILNPNYKQSKNNGALSIDCKLYELGKYLANLYCKASTCKSKFESIEPWWVKSGTPVLFLEIKQNENIKLPKNWQNVVWEFGIFNKFKFLTGSINKQENYPTIPIYIFKSVSKTDYTISRIMRTFALKLIAQQQCFNLILGNAAHNNIELSDFAHELVATYKLSGIDDASIASCQNSLNNAIDFYQVTLNELKSIDPLGKLLKILSSEKIKEFGQKIILEAVKEAVKVALKGK